jgi:hypothetical protein
MTADVAELEQRLARVVLHHLHGTATVEEIEELKPVIDLTMRAVKLFAQNCRLEDQLAKELLANASPGPRAPASEEIASCAPTRPRGCRSIDGAPEASCEPTSEVTEA